MYERGTVFVWKNADILGQSINESTPALSSVVNDVEACVSVVQFQPLYIFWHLKSGWKEKTKLPFGITCKHLALVWKAQVLYFTWFGLQRKHLSALMSQTTAVVYIGYWNIPQAKENRQLDKCSVFMIDMCGDETHLEECVALSDVSRKCSCVRVTWSPLRLTVTNGKPFCVVHELIISDTFWCWVETSTCGHKNKNSITVPSI